MAAKKSKKPARVAKKAAARPAAAKKAKSPARGSSKSGSRRIDQRIHEVGAWRGETLAEVRRVIHEADPDIVEECKWVKPTNPLGVPVWSHNGIVCTGETYKSVVKLTFAKGASLKDPSRLFNSSLDGNVRRAIDIHETDAIDEAALADLIREAVALNLKSSAPGRGKAQRQGRTRRGK